MKLLPFLIVILSFAAFSNGKSEYELEHDKLLQKYPTIYLDLTNPLPADEKEKAAVSANIDNYNKEYHELVSKYSWALPNEELITEIAKRSPIIEIGAGNGYWASLLSKKGADIIAFDNFSRPETNELWFDVKQGDETVLSSHPGRALLLCWPDPRSNLAFEALQHYKGNTLIYIGFLEPGLTATEDFFKEVAKNFDLEKEVTIKSWPHDLFNTQVAYIYKRKNS